MNPNSALIDRLSPKKLFYGWYIVIAGGFASAVILGFVTQGWGVFISEFQNEFGWSVTALAIGFSLRSLEQGLLSPFTGFLQDKLGPRRMAIAGVLLISLGLLMYSQVRSLTVYYIAAGIMALGQSLGGVNAYTLAIMRWFNKKRGRAVGMVNIGNGASYFGPLFLAALIGATGWRSTLLIAAVIMMVVCLPLALVIRERPEDYGLLPDGEPPDDGVGGKTSSGGTGRGRARSNSTSGMEVKEALKTPAFYMLVLTTAAHGFAHSPWNTLQIPSLQSVGFSLKATALIVAVYGVGQIPLRFVIGWLGDIFGRRRIYLLSILLHAIGLVCFAFLTPARLWLLPIYVIVFGIGHGAHNTLNQSLVADYFGPKRYGTLRGLSQSLQLPAAIFSPIFAGRMFDVLGSYRLAYIILGFVSASGILWLALVRRPLWDVVAAAGGTPAAEKVASK